MEKIMQIGLFLLVLVGATVGLAPLAIATENQGIPDHCCAWGPGMVCIHWCLP